MYISTTVEDRSSNLLYLRHIKGRGYFMKKLLLLPLVIFAFTADAYIIDYNAINDDDKSINYGTNSVNYSIDGYKKNDQNVTSVKHDPRRGVYDDSEDDSGLKLKGVNKEDLESLSYGNSLYED